MSELAPVLFALFDAMPVGVVILDVSGTVLFFNQYEEQLARRSRSKVLGRNFFLDVAPCTNVKQLAGEFHDKVGAGTLHADVDFAFPFPFLEQPRDVRVRMRSLNVSGQTYGALLVEDVSLQRAVDRMKESLGGLLVHDMKNPLAAIMANLQFLKLKVDSPQVIEALDESVLAARRLETMLLDLLDISRLETGTFPLRRTTVDLASVIHDARQGNAAIARMHGIELDLTVHDPLPGASIDVSVVRRCIDNLVENAVRYAKKRVTVSAREEDRSFVVEVSDDGHGIADAQKSQVFDKYNRGTDASTARNRGLGLSFVQLATRAHGGEASVHDAEGGGALFRLRFSKASTDAA